MAQHDVASRLAVLAGVASIVIASLTTAALAAASVASGPATSPTTSRVLADQPPHTPVTAAALGALPLSFEPNVGQAPAGVDYVARGSSYSASLSATAIAFALVPKNAARQAATPSDVIRMQLIGANAGASATAGSPRGSAVNYLIGDDPMQWHTNVPLSGQVTYHAVYPGIDAAYLGVRGGLEYRFIVAAGANPSRVQLHFDGAQSLRLDGGDLVVASGGTAFRESAPVAYEDDTAHTPIPAHFALSGNRVSFVLGPHDTSRGLVIDPTIDYSTFLAGVCGEEATVSSGIAADAAGNAYVVGTTASCSFPTTSGAFQTSLAGTPPFFTVDAYITKFNSSGSGLVYSTFLGSPTAGAVGRGIAVDASGDAYVVGLTGATDYPTVHPFQAANRGSIDGFVSELNPTGSGLVFSSYMGGSGADETDSVALDSTGNVYVAGVTTSSDLPVTTGAVQSALNGESDAFVAEVAAGGAALDHMTYLGGSGDEGGDANGCLGNAFQGVPNCYFPAIALDSSNNAYVVGRTPSADFPTTPGSFQPTWAGGFGAINGFVTKFDPTLSTLGYSTYLGAPSAGLRSLSGAATGVAVDAAGDAYVVSVTGKPDFPVTTGSFQTTAPGGGADAAITKLNPGGTGLAFSTFLGGSGQDYGRDLAIDPTGRAYVTGFTSSSDFPTTPNAAQPHLAGGRDAFVAQLDPSGGTLDYSSYLGGSADEFTSGIAYNAGLVFVAGQTESTDFPATPGSFQPTFVGNAPAGASDAFVTAFVFSNLLSLTQTAAPLVATTGQTVTYTMNVANDGTIGDATGVTLNDPLPTAVTYVSATPSQGSCSQSGGTVSCLLGTVAGNSSATVTIVTTAPSTSVALVNTATVSADQSDPHPADNSATTTVLANPADVSVTQVAPATVNTGKPLSYSLTVANAGPAAATGVAVVDQLPSGPSFVSATSSAGTCSNAGGNVTCAIGTVNKGSSATITITITVPVIAPPAPGIYTNTAAVSAVTPDQNLSNNTSSAQTSVIGPGCGHVVSSNLTLPADVGPCPGQGLIVQGTKITINLNGHSVTGSAKSESAVDSGVEVLGYQAVTLKNGSISGFGVGVLINQSNNDIVQGLQVHDNIGPNNDSSGYSGGIALIHSSNNTVKNNTLTHNGVQAGIGVFGVDSNANVIQGNTVTGTVAGGSANSGVGIEATAVLEPGDPRRGQPIAGNEILANAVVHNAGAGIVSATNNNAKISNNDVEDNGVGTATTPRDGIQVTYDAPDGSAPQTTDVISGNTVRGNGDNGIDIVSQANKITSNVTGGNNVNNDGSFDLNDANFVCVSNTWLHNTWGTAGFSQTCETG